MPLPIDPNTMLAAAGGLFATKEILIKIFGPTMDIVGSDMAALAKRCNVNLDNIFKRSVDKGIKQDGEIPIRVAKEIINEGKYIEDPIMTDYMAGFLSSSKTINKNDDRAISYLSIVKQLSGIEIKLHYFVYLLLHERFRGQNLMISMEEHRNKIRLVIPFDRLDRLYNFHEKFTANQLLPYAPSGLIRHDLLGQMFSYGNADHLKTLVPDIKNIPNGGLLVTPSILGAELFLWAAGKGELTANALFDQKLDLTEKFPKEMQIPLEWK
jgi:hypothetical protein